jgi:membrane protease YdiL (CAAX protease family)
MDPAPDQAPAAPQRPPLAKYHSILYGTFGLRAGWSLLIYFSMIAIIAGIGFGVVHQIKVQRQKAASIEAARTGKPAPPLDPLTPKADPSHPAPLSGIILSETVTFGVLFLLSWIMSLIEQRNVSVFGLGGGSRSPARFLVGAVWGLGAMGVLILILYSFHLLTFETRLDHGASIVFWGAMQFIAFLLVGLTEEYMFRGYIQFTLTRGLVSVGRLIAPQHARAIAFWIAAILTSALFLQAHTNNTGENALGLLQVFLAGVVLVVALWRTGSLWWAIGFHTTWDWSQSFLYGVPDSGGLMQGRLFATHALGSRIYSGGTAGPEGSILCIPVLLCVIAALLFVTPASQQPPLEPVEFKPSPGLLSITPE